MHDQIPQKATPSSACYVVYSKKSVILQTRDTNPIETDIGMKFSKNRL